MDFTEVTDVPGIARIARYFADVWNATEALLPSEVLHCIRHAGGSIIAAFEGDQLKGATVTVPTGPGIGVDPIAETLRRFTTATRTLYARN